jgi:hypothetical protein
MRINKDYHILECGCMVYDQEGEFDYFPVCGKYVIDGNDMKWVPSDKCELVSIMKERK